MLVCADRAWGHTSDGTSESFVLLLEFASTRPNSTDLPEAVNSMFNRHQDANLLRIPVGRRPSPRPGLQSLIQTKLDPSNAASSQADSLLR